MSKVSLNCQLCKKNYSVNKYREFISKFCSKPCANSYAGTIGGKKGKGISRNKGAKHPYLSEYNKTHIRYGKEHPLWKGLTSEEKRERSRVEFYSWRKLVFERDNFTCFLCKQRGGNLEAHHILRFIDYKEMRKELSNGITLCKKCHNFTKGKEDKFIELFHKYTKKAVIAFQLSRGLSADGIVGKLTLLELNK